MSISIRVRAAVLAAATTLGVAGLFCTEAFAQNASHPEAKPKIEENPYISYREPWRWDLRSQLFLTSVNVTYDNPATPGTNVNEEVMSTTWQPGFLELVFPVVRDGGFYWTHNEDVDVSVRLDDYSVYSPIHGVNREMYHKPSPPVVGESVPVNQKFVDGTNAEYSHWESGDIRGWYRQLYVKHVSHIVCADSVFNEQLARQLPWPEEWAPDIKPFLSPIVDTVGEPVAEDADETIDTLVKYWIGEETDPRDGVQLDVVKFLTGKVIEYFTIRGQATEFTTRTTSGGRPSHIVSSNTWSGFIVRPADQVAREPQGSRHDLAVLLVSVLRSAGVPARTVICVDQLETDPLLSTVSLVEFAMYDSERDQTFWVPIDVDRVRVSGARSSQFRRQWLYFGTHDELSHMVPVSYYYHPPARYKAFNLPLLYGIRPVGTNNALPEYMTQALLVEPLMTPVSGNNNSQP
jgi:hypothetical protein